MAKAMSDRIKPIGCTCKYPDVILRNMNGHDPSCPIYTRWAAEQKHGKDPSHCPTCGQPLNTERKRICAKCHKPIESIKLITIDHIIPLSRGGSYELKNLTLAHWKCNHAKDNLTQEEFEALQAGDI